MNKLFHYMILISLFFITSLLYNTINPTFHSSYETLAKDSNGYGVYEGDLALPFVLEDAEGNKFDLEGLRGKRVYINFFASWCPPCQEEMPLLVNLNSKLNQDKEVMIGVNMTSQEKNMSDVNLFLKQYQVKYQVVYDYDGKVMEDYRIIGIPTTLVINEDGKIEKRINGLVTPEIIQSIREKN